MIKKTLTYTDFNGETVTEDLWFNLSDTERIRLNARYISGGYTDLNEYLQSLIAKKDTAKMVALVEDVILSAYGQRSDATHFYKTKQIREDFENSIAYAEMFELLFTNSDEMKKFTAGVMQKQQETTPLVQQIS